MLPIVCFDARKYFGKLFYGLIFSEYTLLFGVNFQITVFSVFWDSRIVHMHFHTTTQSQKKQLSNAQMDIHVIPVMTSLIF